MWHQKKKVLIQANQYIGSTYNMRGPVLDVVGMPQYLTVW